MVQTNSLINENLLFFLSFIYTINVAKITLLMMIYFRYLSGLLNPAQNCVKITVLSHEGRVRDVNQNRYPKETKYWILYRILVNGYENA